MLTHPHTSRLAPLSVIFGLVLCLTVIPLNAQMPVVIPANIYGDGDPANGIEDSREAIMAGRSSGGSLADRKMNAGTIQCDGKVRGSASVVDARELAPDLQGVVLVSAAHVLFDLDKSERFRRCEFHFLALGSISGYRAKIDMGTLRMGSFDPRQITSGLSFGEGDWVFLHVPRPWKNFNPADALVLRDYARLPAEPFQQAGGEFRLVAFDSEKGVMSTSRHCTVVESVSGDLGGGTWKGQLLDDCDSSGGASGGGIVAVIDRQQYLVGIRTGSHWRDQDFPESLFPLGPPDGALWDRNSNTNFGRAIDAKLLNELRMFIQTLASMENI